VTKTVEVEQALKELLQDNLQDPNPNRTGNWVFTEKPKTTNRYPYIIISLLDAQKTGFSIGQTDREHRQRIQASVRVKQKNEYEIEGETRGAGYVKWWIAERMDEIVQDNQSKFRDLGDDIYYVLPDSSNPGSPGDTRQTSNDYILFRRRK